MMPRIDAGDLREKLANDEFLDFGGCLYRAERFYRRVRLVSALTKLTQAQVIAQARADRKALGL